MNRTKWIQKHIHTHIQKKQSDNYTHRHRYKCSRRRGSFQVPAAFAWQICLCVLQFSSVLSLSLSFSLAIVVIQQRTCCQLFCVPLHVCELRVYLVLCMCVRVVIEGNEFNHLLVERGRRWWGDAYQCWKMRRPHGAIVKVQRTCNAN